MREGKRRKCENIKIYLRVVIISYPLIRNRKQQRKWNKKVRGSDRDSCQMMPPKSLDFDDLVAVASHRCDQTRLMLSIILQNGNGRENYQYV